MFFSRIQLDINRADLGRLANVGGAGGYRIHQSIWRLFSTNRDETRDFVYRHEAHRGAQLFYAVSAREPQSQDDAWHIETKKYAPELCSGQRLAFVLTANPVVSRRDEAGRQHRHDVVMDLKRAQGRNGSSPLGELAREAGLKWLELRAERLGFRFHKTDLLVAGYRQYRLHKPKAASPIRFSTLEFSGLLTVVDTERFRDKALFNGIGPAKGFGCGLMLIRRA